MTEKFMRSLVLVVLLSVCALSLRAQDWNQWRGPSRTGVTAGFKAPAVWPDRMKQIWKVDAGEGHASPVVSGAHAYLLSRVSDREAVTAFDLATGKQIWRQMYDAPYQVNPAATTHGKGPKSTPVVDGGRLFTFGISGILSAWDASTGRLLWRKDFKSDYPMTVPDFGTAMSPIVVSNLLIVHVGGGGKGALIALDPQTGASRWAWTGDGPSYASPIVADFRGVRQIVTQSQSHVIGIALADGKQLWQIPFTTDYDQNIVTAVVSGELVVYGGLSKPLTAVRVTQSAGKWTTEQVWQNPDAPMYMSSPVEQSGLLFGMTHRNRGQFFCVDAKTGKTLWTTRGREGDNAAVIAAGGLLMATTTEGELIVFRPNAQSFDVVKRYTVAESPIWAHPVPAGAVILIKDATSLSAWGF
jgi:outer membrane protein assembly factor BamB